MTYLLTVMAVSAGGIIALTLDEGARPTPAAIPILVGVLVCASAALLVVEIARKRRKRQPGDDGAEAPPEKSEPPSGREFLLNKPNSVSGTVLTVTGLSRDGSRILPGVGRKVKVMLVDDEGLTIHMEFSEGWAGALGRLSPGERLEGSGWVNKTNSHSVHLGDCTLKEVAPPARPARSSSRRCAFWPPRYGGGV